MGCMEYFGVEGTDKPNPDMMLAGGTGLLISFAALWINTSD